MQKRSIGSALKRTLLFEDKEVDAIINGNLNLKTNTTNDQ